MKTIRFTGVQTTDGCNESAKGVAIPSITKKSDSLNLKSFKNSLSIKTHDDSNVIEQQLRVG